MSTLSIVSATLSNYQRGGTTARLKIWFSETFETAEGLTIIGGPVRSNGFFVDVACAVDPDEDALTYATFSLPTTNDSSVRNARATGMIFDSSGAFVCNLFVNYIIPEQLAPVTTLAALSEYNAAGNVPPNPTYPTTDQIMTLIEEGLQAEPINGTLTDGVVPRASAAKTLENSQITDDGTDVRIDATTIELDSRTIGIGDTEAAANATKISLSDSAETITLKADNGVVQNAPAATTAALLANGQISFYLDQTGHALKIAVKYSTGTTKTGSIALT